MAGAPEVTQPIASQPYLVGDGYPHDAEPSLPGHFSLISAQTAAKPDEASHANLERDLLAAKFALSPVVWNFGDSEKAFLAEHDGSDEKKREAEEIAWRYGQEAVLHRDNDSQRLVFKDGREPWSGEGFVHGPFLMSHYLEVPSGHKIRLRLEKPEEIEKSDHWLHPERNEASKARHLEKKRLIASPHYYGQLGLVHVFHALSPVHSALIGEKVENPEDLKKATETAEKNGHFCVVVHGNPPSEIRHLSYPAAHPHDYSWADANGIIEKADLGFEPDLKAIAERYGTTLVERKTHLHFAHDLAKKNAEADELLKSAQVDSRKPHHFAEDKPGHQIAYFSAWRKLHDLAHAETAKDIESLYGPGEHKESALKESAILAKRAVHYEWLAVHRQRDLAKSLGVSISDEDFHREANSVMHDALVRVLTTTVPDLSSQGFEPHPTLVPLEFALSQIDDAEKKLTRVEKSEKTEPTVENDPSNLTKAFLQGDGESKTDPKDHAAAEAQAHPALMKWGQDNLAVLGRDAIADFEIGDAVLKIRKLLEDLYSGKIERGGQMIHEFTRLTLPELIQQMRSKLELYGKEEEAVAKARNRLLEPGETQMETMHPEEKAEAKELKDIGAKLSELQDRVKRMAEHEETVETVAGKELAPGIENPETECSACEQSAKECSCYTGLPTPRIEFDAETKKLLIFFKGEWSEEDRQNFRDDLIKRAGQVLDRRKIEAARKIRENIRKTTPEK